MNSSQLSELFQHLQNMGRKKKSERSLIIFGNVLYACEKVDKVFPFFCCCFVSSEIILSKNEYPTKQLRGRVFKIIWLL